MFQSLPILVITFRRSGPVRQIKMRPTVQAQMRFAYVIIAAPGFMPDFPLPARWTIQVELFPFFIIRMPSFVFYCQFG